MITEEPFGEIDGRPVRTFQLDDDAGVTARLIDYGARMTELHVPGRDGQTADIVLGFDDVRSYVESPSYFGATVGRYGNRIARGRFTLLSTEYRVDRNEGHNHLHGGRDGWDRRIWDAEPGSRGASITFRTTSADGEMGFPGTCTVSCTYELHGTQLRITMEAVPDATTVINMVHHSYFNLAGHASGDILGQQMRIDGNFYVPADGELLPTGEILAVAGTSFDFRERHAIGLHLDALGPVGTEVGGGGGRGRPRRGRRGPRPGVGPDTPTAQHGAWAPDVHRWLSQRPHHREGRQPLPPVRRLHPGDAEVSGLAAVRALSDDHRPGRRDVPPRDDVRLHGELSLPDVDESARVRRDCAPGASARLGRGSCRLRPKRRREVGYTLAAQIGRHRRSATTARLPS